MTHMPRFTGRISELTDARQEHAYEFEGKTYYVSYVHDASRRPPVRDLEVIRIDEAGRRTRPLLLSVDEDTPQRRLVRHLGLFG